MSASLSFFDKVHMNTYSRRIPHFYIIISFMGIDQSSREKRSHRNELQIVITAENSSNANLNTFFNSIQFYRRSGYPKLRALES